MKALASILALGALVSLTASPAMAADIVAGKAKASANCTGCHGDDHTPGVFFSLQLAGRNADKLAIKTNKYRTGKLFNPLMNMGVMQVSDADVADITAYYQSLGRPFLSAPFIQIKGDDEGSGAQAVAMAPSYAPVYAPVAKAW